MVDRDPTRSTRSGHHRDGSGKSTSILQDIAAPSILGVYGIAATGGALVQILPTNGIYQTADNAGAQIKVIAYQFQYILPLCYLSQYFTELAPFLGSISQLELRVLLNVSPNNSWTVTHDVNPAANTAFGIVGTGAQQSTGDVCPFMVSAISNDGTRGCRVVAADSPVITVVGGVGYYNSLPVAALAAQSTGYRVTQISSVPAQMWIPSVMLTDPMRELLLSNKTKKILYSSYQVDTTLSGGARAQRLLCYSCARLRKLYILPFLAPASATTPANCVDPRQSLVSSAPNTVSYCKLANLQVFLGSTNVYIQPLSYDFLHFFSGPWVQQMPVGGGDWRSMVTSGRIRYSDWRRCYNTFVIDLERCSDAVTDDLIKNIQVSFQNDTQNTYNFVLITEYQEEVTMDCVTGQVVASDGQQQKSPAFLCDSNRKNMRPKTTGQMFGKDGHHLCDCAFLSRKRRESATPPRGRDNGLTMGAAMEGKREIGLDPQQMISSWPPADCSTG
jgi:hypothetical protein